jgi:hypothetical protein
MPSEEIIKAKKVSQNHLSQLMKFILVNTGDGAERGEIFSRYYGFERHYCGWYIDSCLRGKTLRRRQKLYHEKQPVFTKTLKRLENRGLIQIARHGFYVKEIHLTTKGKLVAEQLMTVQI